MNTYDILSKLIRCSLGEDIKIEIADTQIEEIKNQSIRKGVSLLAFDVHIDVNASARLTVIKSMDISEQKGALQRYKEFLSQQWWTSPNSYYGNRYC